MSFYAHQMQKALIGRAGDWLKRNAWPRWAMACAFAVSTWMAYELSKSIIPIGGMGLRFSACVVAGYAAFVLLLAAWLSVKPTLDTAALLDGADKDIETKDPWDCDDSSEIARQIAEEAWNASARDGPKAIAAMALLSLLLGWLFVAVHMVYYAPWYLGKMLVIAGKVRHRVVAAPTAGAWLLAPARQTIWLGVGLLVHYASMGLILQLTFPQAATVADVVQLLRR